MQSNVSENNLLSRFRSQSSTSIVLLLLGIITVVSGVLIALPLILAQGYFSYHLYRTAFNELALTMNRYGLSTLLIIFAVVGLKKIRQVVPGRMGRILCVGIPLISIIAVLYLIATRYPSVRVMTVTYINANRTQFFSLLLHPLFLVSLLLIMIGVLIYSRNAKRFRRQTPGSPLRRQMSKVFARIIAVVNYILFTIWIGVNLIAVLLMMRTSVIQADRPNIVFIMIDTLRADHVGCYGYDLPTTPAIDAFSQQGTRFANAISQAPYTLWSVTSLMSSRYPEVLFPFDIEDFGSTNMYPPMLAEVLNDQGYSTAAVISNPLLGKTPLTAQGYIVYDDYLGTLNPSSVTSKEVTRRAISQLDKLQNRRFFLSLVYMDPHEPYISHPDFQMGNSPNDLCQHDLIKKRYPEFFPSRASALRAYDSEIAYTDYWVGQFLNELKKRGLFENTLIVFFSDHGEEFLEHGFWGHRWTLYDPALKVPLIVKFPNQQKGSVVHGNFPLINLVPSLLKYIDYDPAILQAQGSVVNIATVLRCADKPVYSATLEGLQCVRYGNQKYIRTIDTEHIAQQTNTEKNIPILIKKQELYNLASDPMELHDMVLQTPQAIQPLSTLLQQHDRQNIIIGTAKTFRLSRLFMRSNDTTDEDELRERLKSLNYVNPSAPMVTPEERPQRHAND